MKANELRIGNYVYFHGDVEEINMVDGFGVIGREEQPLCSIDEFEPIPLTEEWLLKFGFKASGEGYKLNNYMLQDFKFGYSLYEWDSYNEVEVCIKNNIEYVHQLQNLYFALTGEELVVKE